MDDFQFRKRFFQAIEDRPLEPGDPRYVHLYAGSSVLGRDPVDLLAEAIRFSPGQSIQLLSGFRGTGKSTELKRLESVLVREGYKVAYLDMERYVNMSTPVDISDFLMAVAGAFGEALAAPEHLGRDMTKEGYWGRLVAFLTRTKITLPDLSAGGVKANLKDDPTFRQELQGRMEGHLGALVADVRKFFEDCVKAIKARHGDETETVLLIDSLEKVRGTWSNARSVQDSVEVLFVGHAEKLKLPNVHLVYTVPPYLKARSMGLGMLYGIGAVQIFPAIKIRSDKGIINAPGVDAMREIVAKRSDDYRRLLGEDERLLERLIMMSGGSIRGLLRLLGEVIRRAKVLPVDEAVVEEAINQIRTEFLPIADADAEWLSEIAVTHEAALENIDRLPDLARFFDTQVVLCYRDGPEWYDVHPLIRDHVIAQVQALEERRRGNAPPPALDEPPA
ncbi:hypothetical protein BE04_42485 [Sorangium cellulosum]|uniref:Orc1-like AAA ATPase domain-containing protein n=1 Tax=Sorangium cellulosum TaxID=56 RepID=A0A150PE15_SORCE|nr:hypothetical protein BE04_42485 [Sorangium cellulosum]